MRVYQLKSRASRATAFALAVGMFGIVSAYALPNGKVSADPLNPLTERTLLLSSSAPGDHYLDAAGNTTYAAPGSGPNGQKTEQTFSFRVSTNSSASGFGFKNEAIKAFSFQYCKTAAGNCVIPGDTTDTLLNAHYGTGAYTPSGQPAGTAAAQGVDFDIYLGSLDGNGNPVLDTSGRVIYTKITYDPLKPWVLGTNNVTTSGNSTAQNYITLTNADSTLKPVAGTPFQIVFKASNTNYITNPKAGAFFVRINDYKNATTLTDANVIDGGVTVANVMTDSIEIRTKVLETMSFSVGTVNPDTENLSAGSHGPCDAIAVNSPLYMGSSDAEYSLEVAKAYDTHSYWRLSSNSSNGASVYYSGYTLSNTVGDQIDAMDLNVGTSHPEYWTDGSHAGQVSHPGMEQFGLAFDTQDTPRDQRSDSTPRGMASVNTLSPLIANKPYENGAGANGGDDSINITKDAKFAFDPDSDQIPSLLATENTDVVGCTTGKMRYVANVAAVTPAGIYSSKVNYLAAPQY